VSLIFALRYIVRSLWRGGTPALLAMTCIAVGIAGIVALQIASATVSNTLISNVRAANGGDISLSSNASPLSAGDLDVFRSLMRAGRIRGWTAASTLHATAVGENHDLIPFEVEVVSSPPYPLGGEPAFASPSNGRVETALARPGDVVVSSFLAQELGAQIGSRFVVNSIGGRGLMVVIRGILNQTNFSQDDTMIVQRRYAGALGRATTYANVFVNTVGPPASLAATLRDAFPSATVQTVTEALQADKAQVHDFQQFLTLVGLLALLIAGIGTLNAMQSMYVRRRLEIAMLKAMGYRNVALYLLFGGEAIILGLGAGVVGALLGALISTVITSALAAALALQVTLVIDPRPLLGAVGLGVGATLIFAVIPIVRATSIRPLELLREGEGGMAWRGWTKTIGLIVLVAILFMALAATELGSTVLAVELVAGALAAFAVLTGLFALVLTVLERIGPPRSRPAGILVLLVLLAGLAVTAQRVTPLAAVVALAVVLWAVMLFVPVERRLPMLVAIRSLSRRQARTSVILVAFLAGVLAMAISLTVAISLRNQINTALATAATNNLVAIANSSSARQIVRASHSLTGVRSRQAVLVAQTVPVSLDGRPFDVFAGRLPSNDGDASIDTRRTLGGVTGYDLAQGSRPTNLTLAAGRTLGSGDSGHDNILVNAVLMRPPFSLSLGDRIVLRATDSDRSGSGHIVGFYVVRRATRTFGSFFTPPVLADRSFARQIGGSGAQSIVVFSVDPTHLSTDAATLQRAVPGALVVDTAALVAIVNQVLGELLDVLAVITALVLGAGTAVVGNGVGLAMLERRREIALFKSVGFRNRSVLGFVLLENALIGTLAGALSVLGVAIALALISHFALRRAVGFDPAVAVMVLVFATGLAAAIAYVAARGPVGVRPIEALRNE